MTASAQQLQVRKIAATTPASMKPVIWPETVVLNEQAILQATLQFLLVNSHRGVRNCEVARALGVTRTLDPRNWFSYGILARCIDYGWITKDSRSHYHLTEAGRTRLQQFFA